MIMFSPTKNAVSSWFSRSIPYKHAKLRTHIYGVIGEDSVLRPTGRIGGKRGRQNAVESSWESVWIASEVAQSVDPIPFLEPDRGQISEIHVFRTLYLVPVRAGQFAMVRNNVNREIVVLTRRRFWPRWARWFVSPRNLVGVLYCCCGLHVTNRSDICVVLCTRHLPDADVLRGHMLIT